MHYKDTRDGKVYGYKKFDTCVQVTVEDFELLKNPPKTAEDLKEEARVQAKADRDTALSAMVHTLIDGSVVQTRPSDLTNFQIAIDLGVSKDWVLKDNTVRLLTVAEMGECLASGVSQADAIWTTYTDFLKAQ